MGGSLVCVLILLLSSILQVVPSSNSAHARTDASNNGLNATSDLPYVMNASTFPYPANLSLGNLSVSSPRLTVTSLGEMPVTAGGGSPLTTSASYLMVNAMVGNASDDNVPLYELSYLARLPNGFTEVMYQTGEVDPNISYQRLDYPACGQVCPHVPINWSAPLPILSLENAAPQGNAIASSGARVAVAVASSGDTRLFWSEDYGFPGSWIPLTATGLVQGTGPQLAMNGCDLLLSTVTSSATLATTFPLSCPPVPSPTAATSTSFPYAGGTLPSTGGGGSAPMGLPPGGIPSVSGVSPSAGPGGTVVYVTGSGFGPGAQVYFGGVPAPVTSTTSSTGLTSIAPPGSFGVVDVQASMPGVGMSPPNPPADQFTYASSPSAVPSVQTVAPATGPAGTSIAVTGTGFDTTPGATSVLFDGVPASQVTVSSSTALTVVAPSGTGFSGAQDIQVKVNGINSPINWPQDVFTYLGTPSPTVIGVLPNEGVALTPVTVVGTEFANPIQVLFNGIPASMVLLLSTTELTALAPVGPPGATVDVTVQEGPVQSPLNAPFDQYSYPLVTWPNVTAVTPESGPVATEVTVYGFDFALGASVYFGPYSSPSVTVVSSQMLTAIAPDGVGPVDVTVVDGGHTSNTSSADRFTYTGTPTTATLPKSVSNAPIVLSTQGASAEEAILASVGSNDSVQWWTSSSAFSTHSTQYLAVYNASLGSPIFTRIGGTDLQVPGGSGQVTVSGEGSYLFAAFTTRAQEVTGLDTMVSTDAGAHWTVGSQLFAPKGSLSDPVAAPSPGGYTYLVAMDNGQGTWEPDEAVVSDTGRLLSPIQPLPGAVAANGTSASGAGVAVDSVMRPLYVWSESNLSNGSVLDYTGGYLTANQTVAYVQTELAKTQPTDYRDFWSPAVYNFQSYVSANLSTVQSDLEQFDHQHSNWQLLVMAQEQTLEELYPLMSVSPTFLVTVGPPALNCQDGGLSTWTDISQFANATGPYVAGTYMAVYLMWLLQSLGCAAIDPPLWLGTPEHGGALVDPTGETGAVPLGTPGTASASWGSITVTPLAMNPNVIELNATPDIPGWSDYSNTSSCNGGFIGGYPSLYQAVTNLSNSTTTVSAWSNTSIPTIYLTHAQVTSTGQWWEKVNVYMTDVAVNYHCDGTYTNSTGKPFYLGSLVMHGTWSTYLGFNPTQPTAILDPVKGSTTEYDLVTNWTNTMLANVSRIAVNGPNGFFEHQSTSDLSFAERFAFDDLVTSGTNYTWSAEIESAAGNNTVAGAALSLEQTNVLSPPLTHYTSYCSFGVTANPVSIYWYSGQNITGISATEATLTWYSNENGTGWATYSDANAASYSVRASVHAMSNGTAWEYVAQLTGLDPWGQYNVTVGVTDTAPGQCVGYENTAAWTFLTAGIAPMTESDYPYDSVTKEGGGALVEWTIPLEFVQKATFVDGNVSYWHNSTDLIQVPISSLDPMGIVESGTGVGVTYGVNLTALQVNTNYWADLYLNFTFAGVRVPAFGNTTFLYAKDTSGDGLTDWEKVQGWNVTYQDVYGGWQTKHEQAVVPWYATNGLVNDYVEKEFGLDPTTIDTAGSHMLDTWNLTFDLGGSGTCPSGFQCWYANNSDPFSFAQTPGGPVPHEPSKTESTAASDRFSSGGLEDDSPNASTTWWQGGSLSVLQGLTSSWLRGVIMTHNGSYTLTVWGKLSWGANPLAASTPLDGYADGSRVDPLGSTDLNVTVTGYTDDNGLPSNSGVAAFIHSYSNAYHRTEYNNFTSQVLSGSNGNAAFTGSFTVTFPVIPIEQFTSLNLSVVQNTGQLATEFKPAAISVDLFDSAQQQQSWSGNSCSISIQYRALTVYAKAPTYIVVPGGNSTLSNQPLGLKHYSGEQNFMLLEVNLNASQVGQNSLTQTDLYYPNASATNGVSGQYSVEVSSGLTNILVPREAFMNSSLGQALINSTDWSIAPQTQYNEYLQQNWSASYWLSATGVSKDYDGVRVYSSTDENCTGSDPCGGIPSDPGAEANNQALAIQGIFVMNVTGEDNLNSLLAGLLLNQSGNFTNWMFPATAFLPSLGLSGSILSVLANSSQSNDGGYGAPISQHKSTTSPWTNFGAAMWNAVSGVVAGLSVVWSAIIAEASFVAELVNKVGQWALAGANSVLSKVAEAVLWAIEEALAYTESGLRAFLAAITQPLKGALDRYGNALESAFTAADGDGGQITPSHESAFWNAASGSVVGFALGLAAAVAVGVAVLDAFTGGGGEVLTSILVPLLTSIAVMSLSISLGTGLLSVGSFSTSAIQTIQGFFTSTWLDVSSAWNDNLALVGGIFAFSPMFLAIATMVMHGQVSDSGPTGAELEIIGAFVFSILAWITYEVAHGGRLQYQGQGTWPSYINDTFVFSAVLGTIGALFGIAAANQADGDGEGAVGYIGSAVGFASVATELAYE